MAAGGSGGSVTSVTTNSSGAASVVAHFPAQAGPPPVAAHDETYDPCPEPYLSEFKRVQNDLTGTLKIDVTVSGGGTVNGTSVHK